MESEKGYLKRYTRKDMEGLYPVGTGIRIVRMEGEPGYAGREGRVTHIDDAGGLHGTWGGCALLPERDAWMKLGDGKERKEDGMDTSKKIERLREMERDGWVLVVGQLLKANVRTVLEEGPAKTPAETKRMRLGLAAMYNDGSVDTDTMVEAYLGIYGDPDINDRNEVGNLILQLGKGDDGEREQAAEYRELLEDNPGTKWFDTEYREPIDTKEWVADRANIREGEEDMAACTDDFVRAGILKPRDAGLPMEWNPRMGMWVEPFGPYGSRNADMDLGKAITKRK